MFKNKPFKQNEDPSVAATPVVAPAVLVAAPAATASQPRTQSGQYADPAQLAADLRAEAAAHRIDAKREREAREVADNALIAAKADADRRVAEESARHKPILEKARNRAIESELRAQATAAGLEDMDLLPLISRGEIKVDDDFNMTGIAEAVAKFKESKPSYFKQATAAPAPVAKPVVTGAPSAPKPGDTGTVKSVKDMTKAEYDAHKKAMRSRLRVA